MTSLRYIAVMASLAIRAVYGIQKTTLSTDDVWHITSTIDEQDISTNSRRYEHVPFMISWPSSVVRLIHMPSRVYDIHAALQISMTSTLIAYQTEDNRMIYQRNGQALIDINMNDSGCQRCVSMTVSDTSSKSLGYALCITEGMINLLSMTEAGFDSKLDLIAISENLKDIQIAKIKDSVAVAVYGKRTVIIIDPVYNESKWTAKATKIDVCDGSCEIVHMAIHKLGTQLMRAQKVDSLVYVTRSEQEGSYKLTFSHCLQIRSIKPDCKVIHQERFTNTHMEVLHIYSYSEKLDSVTLGVTYALNSMDSQGIEKSSEKVYEWIVKISVDNKTDDLIRISDYESVEALKTYYFEESMPFTAKRVFDGQATGYYRGGSMVYLQARVIETVGTPLGCSDAFFYNPGLTDFIWWSSSNRAAIVVGQTLEIHHFSFPVSYSLKMSDFLQQKIFTIRWKYRHDWKTQKPADAQKIVPINIDENMKSLRLKSTSSLNTYTSRIEGYNTTLSLYSVAAGMPHVTSTDKPSARKPIYYTSSPDTHARVIGHTHHMIDLDRGMAYRCLPSHRAAAIDVSCRPEHTGVRVPANIDLLSARFTERHVFLVYGTENGSLGLTVVDLNDGRVFTDTVEGADVDFGRVSAQFVDGADGKLTVVCGYVKEGRLETRSTVFRSAGKESSTVDHEVQFVRSITSSPSTDERYLEFVVALDGIIPPSILLVSHNNEPGATKRSMLILNPDRVGFMAACRFTHNDTLVAGKNTLYLARTTKELIEIYTGDTSQIEWMQCLGHGRVLVKRTGKVVEYDSRSNNYEILRTRFEQSREYFYDQNTEAIVVGPEYVGTVSRSHKHKSENFMFIREGPQLMFNGNTKEDKVVPLMSRFDPEKTLSLNIKISTVSQKGQPIRVNSTSDLFRPGSKVSVPLRNLPSVSQGHQLGFRVIGRNTHMKILEHLTLQSKESDILQYSCAGAYCAKIVSGQKSDALLIETEGSVVLNYTLLSVYRGGQYFEVSLEVIDDSNFLVHFIFQFGRQSSFYYKSQPLVVDVVSEKAKANETKQAEAFSVSMDYNPSKAQKILSSANTSQIFSWDTISKELIIYSQVKSSMFKSSSLYEYSSKVLAAIGCFQVLKTDSLTQILTSNIGDRFLNVSKLIDLAGNSEQLKTDFDEMHFYDTFKCYQIEKTKVRCLFVGRKIKIVTFKLTADSMTVDGESEEYFAYKNIEADQVDFNDQTVMIAGSRVANDDETGKFDLAGVFVYNRLGKTGGSPYVRQLISLDEIYEFTKSNKFRAVLNGDRIFIHGGFVSSVMVFKIGEYTIEGSLGFYSR